MTPLENVTKEFFEKNEKKHLLITGERGSGKSTLLNKIKKELLRGGDDIPGITTYLIPQKCVMLRENGTEREAVIGIFSRGMKTVSEGFTQLGVPAIKRAGESEIEWAVIDEIGFLESQEEDFKQEIRDLFDKKRVIAVLRKQNLPFIEELKERQDSYVIDLDDYQKKVGCVLMASGLSVRFGKNKLLQEFQGKTMIQRAIECTKGIFTKCVVVTRSEEVENICQREQIQVIRHMLPNRNDTIRIGCEALKDMDGIVFCPCDQPFLETRTLQKMRNYFQYNEYEILRLTYKEHKGMPVLFDKKYFSELMQLPEKCGGSYIMKKYPDKVTPVEANCERELWDIDTPKDLEKAMNFLI